MAVYIWNEPCPASRGRWAGRYRRSELVGSCSPLYKETLSATVREGRVGGRG